MALRIIYLSFTYFVCLLDISWEQKTFHWIVIQQQASWVDQSKFSSIFTIFFKCRLEGYFLLNSIFGYNFLRSRTVKEWLLKEFKSCLGVSYAITVITYVQCIFNLQLSISIKIVFRHLCRCRRICKQIVSQSPGFEPPRGHNFFLQNYIIFSYKYY